MKFFFALILSLGFSLTTMASTKGLSAHRLYNESYEAARDRHLFTHNLGVRFPGLGKTETAARYVSAERAKKPLKSLNLSEIPDVGSLADLENQFFYIRDTRFLATENTNFPRRITWLYPDDGCYARAEVAKFELVNHHFPEPKKIFVFGNLSAASKNSPTGSVQWWYHVAVAYRVGDVAYVFDPSLEPMRPLTITEWHNLVGGNQTFVQYSICSQGTFDPAADCYQPRALSQEDAVWEQKSFLKDEWSRILELKRNPEQELGNNPPWLKN